MSCNRRLFLKSAGAAGLALASAPAHAARALDPNTPAVLVDTTRCIGCRGCEAACAEANGLPDPPDPPGDIFATRRETSTTQFTVVNRSPVKSKGDERFAKTQCLHCVSPGCASACPVRALEKTSEGPVVYHADRCIGCRYCMVACPFGVPKYEYQKAVPYVRKCTFCYERQVRGLKPACTEACPAEALTFGRREDLLLEAKRRVFAPGSGYVPYVYGERESGGTSWLYISDVPLESLGLRTDVSSVAPSERTDGALGAVPVVMTLWPPLLMGLYAFAHERRENDKEDDHV